MGLAACTARSRPSASLVLNFMSHSIVASTALELCHDTRQGHRGGRAVVMFVISACSHTNVSVIFAIFIEDVRTRYHREGRDPPRSPVSELVEILCVLFVCSLAIRECSGGRARPDVVINRLHHGTRPDRTRSRSAPASAGALLAADARIDGLNFLHDTGAELGAYPDDGRGALRGAPLLLSARGLIALLVDFYIGFSCWWGPDGRADGGDSFTILPYRVSVKVYPCLNLCGQVNSRMPPVGVNLLA